MRCAVSAPIQLELCRGSRAYASLDTRHRLRDLMLKPSVRSRQAGAGWWRRVARSWSATRRPGVHGAQERKPPASPMRRRDRGVGENRLPHRHDGLGEYVAGAAFSADDLARRSVRLEHLAQPSDLHIDRPIVDLVIVQTRRFEQLVA